MIIWPLNVTDAAQVDHHLSSLNSVDLVIHSAGIRGLVPSVPVTQSSDVAKAETMSVMTAQTMEQTFQMNAVGTFVLLRALIPKLTGSGRAKVVIMGSRMGSIGCNSAGGGYAYRASKAALNAIVTSFSVDVPEVVFCVVHPGRVESNLVGKGVREDGAITAEESVRHMLELIPKLNKGHSGHFMDRWGQEIDW